MCQPTHRNQDKMLGCDLITRLVILPQQVTKWEETLPDVRIRRAALGWKDKATEAYQYVRTIHDDLGLDTKDFVEWEDVPITQQDQQSTKRKPPRNQLQQVRTNPAHFRRMGGHVRG